ncbi:hypothetical protein ACWV27_01695 [Massilia varians]
MHSTPLQVPLRNSQGILQPDTLFRSIAWTVCILTTLSFLFLPLPTLQWFSDYWEHASAIRVLAENPLAPTNPHYATLDPDRQFIPLFVVLGWLMKTSGISVYTALGLAAILTTVLFFAGVSVFSKSYFRHPWAPVVMISVMMFCWGMPWIWTGFYEFRAIFYNNFYPASFVLSLTFFFWALVLRMLRHDSVRLSEAFALIMLSAFMFVTHQLGGLFAVGGAVLFLIFEEPRAATAQRLKIFLLVVAGIGITWWWPYFNPVELTFSGSGDKENEGPPQFYQTVQVLMMMGPALIGVPILLAMLKKGVHLPIVVGFAGVFCAYAAGGYLGHPVAHRFLLYAILFLHLAIVWWILALLPSSNSSSSAVFTKAKVKVKVKAKHVLFFVIGLLVATHVGFGALDFVRIAYERITGNSFGTFPNHPIPSELSAVAEVIPDDAILFTTYDPALAITALKGKVIARPRPQLMISDGAARTQDNKRFFSTNISNAERMELIRKYGAQYILIKKDNIAAETLLDLEQLGKRVATDGQLILIKLNLSA